MIDSLEIRASQAITTLDAASIISCENNLIFSSQFLNLQSDIDLTSLNGNVIFNTNTTGSSQDISIIGNSIFNYFTTTNIANLLLSREKSNEIQGLINGNVRILRGTGGDFSLSGSGRITVFTNSPGVISGSPNYNFYPDPAFHLVSHADLTIDDLKGTVVDYNIFHTIESNNDYSTFVFQSTLKSMKNYYIYLQCNSVITNETPMLMISTDDPFTPFNGKTNNQLNHADNIQCDGTGQTFQVDLVGSDFYLVPKPVITESSTPTRLPSISNTPTTTISKSSSPTSTDSTTGTPTPTRTPSISLTPTNTATHTPSHTPTGTSTPSNTPTGTGTQTPTNTNTPSNTLTSSPTPSNTMTGTPSHTSTTSSTNTKTQSPTSSITASPTGTQTPSGTSSDTVTPTSSSSQSNTMTPTESPTQTSTPSNTPTQTSTPTPSPSDNSTASGTPSNSFSKTPTISDSQTPTPSSTGTLTATPSPTSTNSQSMTGTPTQTSSSTSSNTPTPTSTLSSSSTNTPTPLQTPTPSLSLSSSHTPTSSSTQTPSNTETSTPSSTISSSQSPTQTQSSSNSQSITASGTISLTPTSTPSSTSSNTQTSTSSQTSSSTPSFIPSNSRTFTSTPSNTKILIQETVTNTPSSSITISNPSTPSSTISTSTTSSISNSISTSLSNSIQISSSNTPSSSNLKLDTNIQPPLPSQPPINNINTITPSKSISLQSTISSVVNIIVSSSRTPSRVQSIVSSQECNFNSGICGGLVEIDLIAPSGSIITINNPDIDLINQSDTSDIVSFIVDFQLSDGSTDLGGDVEVCFESNHNSNDNLCLGYLDESLNPPEWICQDHCLQKNSDGLICGNTDHFTNFALLLSGSGNKGNCGDDGDYWITGSGLGDFYLVLSCALFCLIVAVIFVYIVLNSKNLQLCLMGREGMRIRMSKERLAELPSKIIPVIPPLSSRQSSVMIP